MEYRSYMAKIPSAAILICVLAVRCIMEGSPMGIVVPISHTGETIFENGDPAYNDDAAASHHTSKEDDYDNAHRKQDDKVCHIDAHWIAIGVRAT